MANTLIYGYDPMATESSRQFALLRNLSHTKGDIPGMQKALDTMLVIHKGNNTAMANIHGDKVKVQNMSFTHPLDLQYTRADSMGMYKEEHKMESQDMTMLSVLSKNSDMFSQYLDIVKQAKARGCYEPPSKYITLFVPTNAAFVRMSDYGRRKLVNWDPNDFIKYHSYDGRLFTYDLKGTRVKILTRFNENPELVAEGRGPQIRLGLETDRQYAHIIQSDIVCSDGILQIIDGVLLPSCLKIPC